MNLLALALVLAPPVALGEELEAPVSGLERVVYELEDLRGIDSESLLDILVISGPTALPDLASWLAEDSDSNGEDASEEGKDFAPHFSPAQRDILRRALAGIPAWVRDEIDPGPGASAHDLASLRIAFGVIETLEMPDACDLAVSLASGDGDPHGDVPRLLQDCLSARLRRAPAEVRSFDDLMARSHPELRLAMVRAAGKAPSAEVADFLTRRLDDGDDELELVLLAELGRVVAVTRVPCDPSVEMRVSAHLHSADAALRREAALAAGRLDLQDTTRELIDLLEDEDGGVRSNAAWSLERITGRKETMDADRWRKWHESEVMWWSGEAAEAFDALHGGTPFEVGRAMRRLSGHRLYRHPIAEDISSVLYREEPSLVVQACAVLSTLGSGLAVPALVETLSHEDEGAREAAYEALQAITERNDLSRDPADWDGR